MCIYIYIRNIIVLLSIVILLLRIERCKHTYRLIKRILRRGKDKVAKELE